MLSEVTPWGRHSILEVLKASMESKLVFVMPSESRFDEAKACFQGKIDDLHLVRAVSPTHTEVRVFKVFVNARLFANKRPLSNDKRPFWGLYQT